MLTDQFVALTFVRKRSNLMLPLQHAGVCIDILGAGRVENEDLVQINGTVGVEGSLI